MVSFVLLFVTCKFPEFQTSYCSCADACTRGAPFGMVWKLAMIGLKTQGLYSGEDLLLQCIVIMSDLCNVTVIKFCFKATWPKIYKNRLLITSESVWQRSSPKPPARLRKDCLFPPFITVYKYVKRKHNKTKIYINSSGRGKYLTFVRALTCTSDHTKRDKEQNCKHCVIFITLSPTI